jgi:hypothetical protein
LNGCSGELAQKSQNPTVLKTRTFWRVRFTIITQEMLLFDNFLFKTKAWGLKRREKNSHDKKFVTSFPDDFLQGHSA